MKGTRGFDGERWRMLEFFKFPLHQIPGCPRHRPVTLSLGQHPDDLLRKWILPLKLPVVGLYTASILSSGVSDL